MKRNNKCKTRFLIKVSFCFTLLLITFLLPQISNESLATGIEEDYCYLSDIPYIKEQSSVGWGNITLDQNLDTKYNQGLITLIVNGEQKKFLKGVAAHATSTLIYDISELDYDYFSTYYGVDASRGNSGNGVKFIIYTSVDGENWDPETPDTNVPIKKGNSEAEFIQIDIRGKNYIKLYAHNNNNADSDHSVYANAKLYKDGYIEDNTQVDFIKTVEEYDEILNNKTIEEQLSTYELTVLQRTLVKNVGYDILQAFAKCTKENKETLSWLINDVENLRLYVLGGKPDGGSYHNSLNILSKLYNAKYVEITRGEPGVKEGENDKISEVQEVIDIKDLKGVEESRIKSIKEDLEDETPTNNRWYPELTKGDVYKKMLISLSLTHSTAVGYWAQINHPTNRSDALERYKIYKYLYDNKKFVVIRDANGDPRLNADNIPIHDQTPWFEALKVEEMRYVMNNITDDEELIWLNEYTQKRIDTSGQAERYLQPHTYIAYIWPNFAFESFHAADEKDYFDNWFEGVFTKYHVTHSSDASNQGNGNVYKAWMSMRNGKYSTGAVCGGISKLGTHIRAAHGAPASVIGQPGHAAIIYYRKDNNGYGYWSMDNDISGWAQSGKSEKMHTRMPLGWGNDSYVSGWAATYMMLSQEALNDYENYEKAEEILMTADIYIDNIQKQEEIYRKALTIQPIHIDAWYELIKLYKSDEYKAYLEANKENNETVENLRQEALYDLAEEMAESLECFPLPVYNLLNQIKPELTSTEYKYQYTVLEKRTLENGANCNITYTEENPYTPGKKENVFQPSITKVVAKYLLGQTDTSIATFSFDGADAGKLVFSSRFNGNGFRFEYSLDGKQTWREEAFSADVEHKWQLTPEEITSITSENDIYINIVGVPREDKNLYKIDIQNQNILSNLYANDLENRIVGVNLQTQWRYTEDDEWTSYSVSSPDLTGNKTVQVRQNATGTKLASPSSEMYTFTEDNQPDTRKYISVSHITLHSVSTQATNNQGAATNAIDANYNTRWHSAWNGTDIDRFITVRLDKSVCLSAVEFVPAGRWKW